MGIDNLPAGAQKVIQDGWVLRHFQNALAPNLLYRTMFDALEVPQHLGQKYSFTRDALFDVVQEPVGAISHPVPLNAASTVEPKYEQYEVTLQQFRNNVKTNLLSSGVAISDLYVNNAKQMGFNAGQSLDIQSRRRAFQSYAGGLTYLTAGETASTTVDVLDISGFDFVYVNGARLETTVANPHPVTITQSGTPAARNVTGAVASAVDYANDKVAGTLTLSVAVTAVIGDRVKSNFAPLSLRPNGRSTSYNLQSGDVLTHAMLNTASKQLMAMGVPPHSDTFYHAYLTPTQIQQLQEDGSIQKIYETHPDAIEFQRGAVGIVANCKIFMVQQAPNSTEANGIYVERGLVTGRELGYEVRSSLIKGWLESTQSNTNGYVQFDPNNYVAMILRPPIDDFMQEVSNSWSFIGNFVTATDVFGTLGSQRYYRRAVMLETAGIAV